MVESPCPAPGQRAQAQAPLDATARVALRSGDQVVPAPTHRRRHTPRGFGTQLAIEQI
jgi:predicted amidophosphoribosyltransferase